MITNSGLIDQRARLMGYWEEALRVARETGYWRDVEACGSVIEAFKVREVLIYGAFSGDSAAALAAWDECGHAEREYRRLTESEARLQAPRPDTSVWWEVLGVAPNAPAEAIRATYLDRLKQCHPDRVSGLAPELVQLAEAMAKQLTKAFDEANRSRWSEPELLAGFMLMQFLQDHWGIPKALLDECSEDAGPEFSQLVGYWILIYCAWLFRLAGIRQFDGTFEKDMMAAVRVRLRKPEAVGIKDLADSLEFWFKKLDAATSEAMTAPAIKGVQVPSTYFATLTFVALDPDSPWHMHKEAPPDSLLHGVTMAISKVHHRSWPARPRELGAGIRDY